MVMKKGWNLIQLALIVLNLAIRTFSSLYMIISDCDETFNYWEPLNLLLRGFGKQTWEYSPEYAIRSYAYLIPYFAVAYPVKFIASLFENLAFDYSYYLFYVVRIIALNGFTSYAEIKLYLALNGSMGQKVANWFLLFTSIVPGMSHAGVALLPSSFAMQFNLLALSEVLYAISFQNTSSYILAIVFFLIGGIVGWPFALVLGLTFGLYTVSNIKLWKQGQMWKIVGGCAFSLSIILFSIIVIDSYFFDKWVLVPLNIVTYNVFGGEGEGPEIFGVEPFSYYILNLLVNFNIVFPLGYLGLVFNPILLLNKISIALNVSLPLLIWSAIFFSQPHKEERFLYPIYPLINLSAAILTSKIFSLVGQVNSKIIRSSSISNYLNRLIQFVFVSSFIVVSTLRIFNLVENYSAPLRAFEHISSLPNPVLTATVNVCVGKEWYHYPNSFFLPQSYRFRFVKSGFDGLLPGDFKEDYENFKDVTSFVPLHMNNKNRFEVDKVIDFDQCDYYVDNTEEVDVENGEPRIIQKTEGKVKLLSDEWNILGCNKIIDPNGNHQGLGRLLYIPIWLRKAIPYEVKYLDFCILKRKDSS